MGKQSARLCYPYTDENYRKAYHDHRDVFMCEEKTRGGEIWKNHYLMQLGDKVLWEREEPKFMISCGSHTITDGLEVVTHQNEMLVSDELKSLSNFPGFQYNDGKSSITKIVHTGIYWYAIWWRGDESKLIYSDDGYTWKFAHIMTGSSIYGHPTEEDYENEKYYSIKIDSKGQGIIVSNLRVVYRVEMNGDSLRGVDYLYSSYQQYDEKRNDRYREQFEKYCDVLIGEDENSFLIPYSVFNNGVFDCYLIWEYSELDHSWVMNWRKFPQPLSDTTLSPFCGCYAGGYYYIGSHYYEEMITQTISKTYFWRTKDLITWEYINVNLSYANYGQIFGDENKIFINHQDDTLTSKTLCCVTWTDGKLEYKIHNFSYYDEYHGKYIYLPDRKKIIIPTGYRYGAFRGWVMCSEEELMEMNFPLKDLEVLPLSYSNLYAIGGVFDAASKTERIIV